MKPPYADYSNHAYRFYASTGGIKPTKFLTASDQCNWECAEGAIQQLGLGEREAVCALYRMNGRMQECVPVVAAIFHMDAKRLWDLIAEVTRDFAMRRGLI